MPNGGANTVNYTIVYLLEKYNNATNATSFEYDSSRTASGQVGTVVRASNAPNITGTRNGYEKDTGRNANSQIVISADGSAVLTVYYRLIRYTLVFNISLNSGRITMGGRTYTGSNYKIENVVLGQDVSPYWPATASEIYDTGSQHFRYWSGASGNYVTKRYELIWDNVSNANSNHVMTYKGNWTTDNYNRNAEYWLQQPDGTYAVADEFTQIGLNTNNLGAKDIDGYTKHTGTPAGYLGSGNTDTITSVTRNNNGNYVRDDNKIGGNNRTYYEFEGHLYRTRRMSGDESLTRYNVTITQIYTYRFYYDRVKYSIEYYYGTTRLQTKSDILFGANINSSTYNYEPHRPSGIDHDYEWDGWFSDSGCLTPFTFTTMPGHNLALYTKWHAPSFLVTFHLNYDGAAPEPYFERDVEKYKTVTEGLSQDDQNKLNNPAPALAHHSFQDWYTHPKNGTIFDPAGKTISEKTDVYAHWKPNAVSYTVNYYRTGTTDKVLESKTVSGNLVVGQEITEYAPYITGYMLDGEETTMIADAGSRTIVLDYENNVITFYYGKKPENIEYTVRYVLFSDKDKPADQQTKVAEPVTKSVSGSHTNVTETAVSPTVAQYLDYRPTKTTDTLALGTDIEQNVLTFYYTKGAHLEVKWIDMEEDNVRASVDTYLEEGETYILDTAVSGYSLDHVEKNGVVTDDRRFTAASNTEQIGIKVYYKKNLTILAHNATKPYDGALLELEDLPANVSAEGLKSGHTLSGISISGSQTNVGTSECRPTDAVISGLGAGLTADQFYNINYLPGMLTVSKISVVISVEPDRWTGNVYDGTHKAAGFANGEKTIADYIIVSNADYRNAYLEQYLWPNLRNQLLGNGRGYVEVPNALKSRPDGPREVTGLRILNPRDAGDYYEESSYFLAAATAAIAELPREARDNYNLILYVRECRVEIERAPLHVETEGASKDYDGTPLTKGDLKVTVRGASLTSGDGRYTLAEGDTVTITATGSQTHPGVSQNIYEIVWGDVNQDNYALSEDLGKLEVLPRPIIIEAQDVYKAFGTANDPAFAVKVYPAKYVQEVDEGGNPRFDENGDPIYKTLTDEGGQPVLDENGDPVRLTERDGAEIPATLTHWGQGGYTLKLNDAARGYTDNLSIEIEREEGELPGTYAITPSWADDAEKNYYAVFDNGRLSICVARVSNDGGETWSYHQWLENDEGFRPTSAYDAGTDDPSQQGAFDRARALGGDVIVETLSSNETFAQHEKDDRYVLGKQVVLDSDKIDSLVFRTIEGADFTSVVSRGYGGESLFAHDCALTLEHITLEGDKDAFAGTSDGGLVHVRAGGALSVGTGVTLQNSVTSGKGGAVFVDGTNEGGKRGSLTIVIGASITGNVAMDGGNAVFVGDGGSLTMTGGSITQNNGDTHGAVEVGGTQAKLTFSGDAVVYDNLTDGDQCNVYLNHDEAGIINAAGLTLTGDQGAKIGVYVEDTAAGIGAEEGKLFENRGGVLDRFGTYSKDANLRAFYNDRNGLRGSARGTDEVIWVQPIVVEVRYVPSLKDFETMPTPALSSYSMKPSTYMVLTTVEYVPSLGGSGLDFNSDTNVAGFSIDQIEEDIHTNYGGSASKWASAATDSMVFWRGYAEKEDEFAAYLKSLRSDPGDRKSNLGKWTFVKNNDAAATDDYEPVGDKKLVLYYTEPAYLTISSDCGLDMDDGGDMMVMLAGYKRASGDTTTYIDPSLRAGLTPDSAAVSILDCAYVAKVGDVEQAKPYRPVTADDLALQNGESITLAIPGAVGAMYWADGRFKDVINDVTVISVDRYDDENTDLNENPVKLVTGNATNYPSTAKPALPLSRASASEYHLYGGLAKQTHLHFGEAYICKITDTAGNLLRADGKIQAFKSLEEGFKAYADNDLSAYTTKEGNPAEPAYIKMLVEDYDLKVARLGPDYSGWKIPAPANKPVTLTTAATTDKELPGPFEGTAETRCIIKRGAECKTSMFKVPANANLSTENVIFDGGAVFEDGIYVSDEIADNGSIAYVESKGSLTIKHGTTMQNAAVTSVDNKAKKGGAIYVEAYGTLNIKGVSSNRVLFENCQANGGGAIFSPGKSGGVTDGEGYEGATSIEYCTFSHCHTKGRNDGGQAGPCGGGAVRHMVNELTLDHCEFTDCTSVEQGGAVYHKGKDVFVATYCTFKSCSVYDSDTTGTIQAASGGMETQSASVTVDRCDFEDCSSSKNAGAMNVFNTDATITVSNSTFIRCKTTGAGTSDYGNGGALRTTGTSTKVENCTFDHCEANNRGGAIHCRTSTTIKGTTTIKNCTANIYGGGAVYLENGILTIEAVSIKNCEAPDGGAIYQGGGTCNFSDGTISDCKTYEPTDSTGGSGGGLFLAKGTFNMQGGTIEACNAYGNGGGVCLNSDDAKFNLKGGTVTRCNSLASGGGVYQGGGTFAFSGGEINRCYATAGGGVYINKSKGVTISKDGVAIRDCREINIRADEATGAFMAADSQESGNRGGGLYQHGGTLTITKASITGCSAYDGGGIYLDGAGTRMYIGEDKKSTGGNVEDCAAVNDGGGICLSDGTMNVYKGTSILRNASGNGAGVYQGDGTLLIHDGSIKSNVANNMGGGIYLGGGTFTLEEGAIGGLNDDDTPNGGNEAKRGGGLFVADGSETAPTVASIKGGLIGGNHATEVAGGGGIAFGGPYVTLNFEGAIHVWGNTMEPNPDHPEQTTCDVCLSEHSVEIIRTTSAGLNEDSHIGVYVPDWQVQTGEDAGRWLHQDLHGTTGLPFGTFEKNGKGDNYLNRFINNRSGKAFQGYEYYYGVRKPETVDPDHRIYWADYVCEITDPDGNLLFTNSKATAPALYQYLDKYGAFEALRNHTTFYTKDKRAYTGTEFHVRMLVLDYDMKWPDSAVVPGNVTIKLTMADKTDDCLPQKIKRQYDVYDGITTIRRGVCTGSMLTTAANSDLTIESVTLDGHGFENKSWTTPVQVDGGLISASGNVTLGEKTLLCNSYTTKSNKGENGGAIAYSGPGTLTMSDGSVIDHCKAQNNGAVVFVNASGATEANPVNIVMQDGALWQNCKVTNGLVYVTAGVVNLSGTFDNKSSADDTAYNVSGCTVGSGGGLAYVAGGTLNANGQIREFAANNGGAIYVNGTGVVTVNAEISSCAANENGGGVYVNSGTATLNGAIGNCAANNGGALYVNNTGVVTVNAGIGTCTANASGGGLFVNKGTATLNGAVEHCEANNGGAIYVSGNGTANVNEGISDCAAQANGGGVFVNSGTANLDGMLENCMANNGGAVYANGSGGVANVNAGIDGCTARASGGGVYANQGTANLNGTIENCSANDGGAAFVNSGGTINHYAGIEGCSAVRYGGGVYVNKGSLNMTQAVQDTGASPSIKGCAAVLGGAVFETGEEARVNIAAGEISGNTVTSYGGAALRMEAGAQAEITGAAEIKNNKVMGTGEKFGAAINVKKGTLTLSGGVISGNVFEGAGKAYGGAIHLSGMLSGGKQDESTLIMTGGAITGNTANGSQDVYGGAISLRGTKATATISGGTITGNSSTVTASGKGAYGGAVALLEGATLALSGGTIVGNTVTGAAGSYGAGIYVDEKEGTTLEISGAPDFGGADTGDERLGDSSGNFVLMSGYSDKTNGGKGYPSSNKVRQDIYIAEKRDGAPQSIVVAGDLVGEDNAYIGDGTIWVWAQSEEHYKQTMPFARFGEGVRFAAAHLKAFRNARDDETTENATEDYLCGTSEGDVSGYVYWTGISGSRKVILRKVDSDFNSVGGKTFTVYKGSSSSPYKPKGETEGLSGLASNDTGCIYVGVFVNGWYIIEEDISPKAYFYLIADDSGVYGTLVEGGDGKDVDKVGGYGTRAEAEAEASARYLALRAAAKDKAAEQNG